MSECAANDLLVPALKSWNVLKMGSLKSPNVLQMICWCLSCVFTDSVTEALSKCFY